MWENIGERFFDLPTVICTILAFLIPYITFKINNRLHKIGDQPWKDEEKS